MMDRKQAAAFSRVIPRYMQPDESYESSALNLYDDTPDFWLIRASLLKPSDKEKLRLRCGRIPTEKNSYYERRVSIETGKKTGGLAERNFCAVGAGNDVGMVSKYGICEYI